MITPSSSLASLSAGSSIQGVQQRIAQLESMISAVNGANQTQGTDKPFKSFLGDATPPPKVSPMTNLMQERKADVQPLVAQYAERYGLDKHLINAVIRQESGFNPNAVSNTGAQGLMQLMPATAKAMGVNNAFDPVQSIAGGAKYLAMQLKRYRGNITLALAAYNAGPGAVDKHGGVPPYAETQNYVRRVLAAYLAQKNQANPMNPPMS